MPEMLPEDWDRAPCVVAHPDGMECGAAGAVARWTAQGKEVVSVLASRGEAGIDTMAPDECAPVREAGQRASAAGVGVSVVEFLDHPDGTIEDGIPVRRDLAAAIRRHRPEVVVGIDHRDTGGRALPQHGGPSQRGPRAPRCRARRRESLGLPGRG